MSKFKAKVEHIPSFKRWMVNRAALVHRLEELGIKPFPEGFAFFDWYYFTTLEDWGKVLLDLTFKSDLYSPTFKCPDYALQAQTECARRHKLNSLRMCLDKRSVEKGHAYDLFPYGDGRGVEGIMLFEPNGGYKWSGALEIGDFNYRPELVLI